MTLTVRLVLFIAAVVCFAIGALAATRFARIDWQNAGLALTVLAIAVG